MASELTQSQVAERLKLITEILLDNNRLQREQNAKDKPINSVAELKLVTGNDPEIMRQASAAKVVHHTLQEVAEAVAEHRNFSSVGEMLAHDQREAQKNAGKPRRPARSASEILGMPEHERVAPYRVATKTK